MPTIDVRVESSKTFDEYGIKRALEHYRGDCTFTVTALPAPDEKPHYGSWQKTAPDEKEAEPGSGVWALQLAAQAWCTPQTERITMDERLARAFADILVRHVPAPDPDATCEDCPVDRLLDGLREARATMRACRTTLGDDSADTDRLIGTWRDFPARKAAK